MKNIQFKYPNKLKELRKANNLTQKDVAIKLRLSPGNQDRISKWECGVATPNLDNLIKLCRVYKSTLEELYPHSGR